MSYCATFDISASNNLTMAGEPVPLNTPSDPIVKAVVSESNFIF